MEEWFVAAITNSRARSNAARVPITSASEVSPPPATPGFDWSGLTCEHIPLRWPLLVVHGSKGMLACGYINSPTGTNRTGDAAACMTLCITHADFLDATVKEGSVSEQGVELGLKDGMSGREALELIR